MSMAPTGERDTKIQSKKERLNVVIIRQKHDLN